MHFNLFNYFLIICLYKRHQIYSCFSTHFFKCLMIYTNYLLHWVTLSQLISKTSAYIINTTTFLSRILLYYLSWGICHVKTYVAPSNASQILVNNKIVLYISTERKIKIHQRPLLYCYKICFNVGLHVLKNHSNFKEISTMWS